MTPFWIINFLEKDSCESFFNSYWNAILQKKSNGNLPLKFFYITQGWVKDMNKEKIEEIARMRLAMDTEEGEDRLIPAFTKRDSNEINVIFIGDITQEKTIERFHIWAAYLRRQLIQKRWSTISRVSMYAILLRPETIVANDGVLTYKVKAFLNELNTLESMDINHRPFDRVLFIQAPIKAENRAAAEDSANLAAYHIARTDGKCFNGYHDKLYYDTNSTAVFFETDVQKGIDAYNLSVIMLHDMVSSEDKAFYNVKEAESFVDDNQDYVNTMIPLNMSKFIVSECPRVPDFNLSKPLCHPLNIFKMRTVWKEYYNSYIVGMKSNLVNTMQRDMATFEKDFCNALYERQHKFITEQTYWLQNLVFQMFCDIASHGRFKHIGLKQCLKVLELFKSRIKDAFNSEDKMKPAFDLPVQLESAIIIAKQNNMTPNKVLDELTSRLERLPVYNMSRFLRSALLGLLVGVPLAIFLSPIALVALPLAILIDMLVYNSKVKRIESLKNQYVGMKLQEIRERLNEELQKCIDKTKDEMRRYMKWLRDKKIVWLQDNLSVLAPPSNQFNVSKVFQPLLNASPNKSNKLIQTKDIDLNISDRSLMESGSFGQNPIVKNVPNARLISEEDGSSIGIFDLVNDKMTVQKLVQELMHSDEDVKDGVEQDVEFQKHEGFSDSRNMLLLLDVSGSMYGDMDSLRDYVKNLEDLGNIEWIAFDDKVVATSRDSKIEELTSGGGTCYIPAIREAVKWVESEDYDYIVLLSDGGPFEPVNRIVEEAKALDQPLNTIAVGTGAAVNVLIDIAMETGGEEISVSSFEEINHAEKWTSEILPRLALLNNGNYLFGELMKHTQVGACAKALQKYALKRLDANSLTIPILLDQYICKDGFIEWIDYTSQRNTLVTTAEPQRDKLYFATMSDDRRSEEKMESRILEICNGYNKEMSMCLSENEPELIVSLMSIRPLLNIGDLQWASTLKKDDESINDKDTMKSLLQEGYSFKNIYDEEIKNIL
ncbi:MAG: VWA domain-containing protein [Bacteroidales bacterium]|nr:VWA domain-containing protein [Bacteroidales bacterium]